MSQAVNTGRPHLGHDVYHWPEVRSLLKRLGVEWEAPTTSIMIHIPEDGLVRITHEYIATDRFVKTTDDTTLHDEPHKATVQPEAVQ